MKEAINSQRSHLIVVDAIPFFGGSKTATMSMLSQLGHDNTVLHVLTSDSASWQQSNIRIHRLFESTRMKRCETGLGYFLRHLWIALTLSIICLRYGRRVTLLGASGPGVDLSIYLVGQVFKLPIIQCVHGPVARSRTIARCLLFADLTLYLPTTLNSIKSALASLIDEQEIARYLAQKKLVPMLNGLPQERWPSATQDKFQKARLFWAASLLKWKGLDTLCEALAHFPVEQQIHSTVCYIRPRDSRLEVSPLPNPQHKLDLHETPKNLDQQRAACNIFVSTSTKEPFGLSILESMAAGLCIVIPKDGAYWDKVLEDGVHCIKYRPCDAHDLFVKLAHLSQNMTLAKHLAKNAQYIAQSYRAELIYKPVVMAIYALLDQEAVCSCKADARLSAGRHCK